MEINIGLESKSLSDSGRNTVHAALWLGWIFRFWNDLRPLNPVVLAIRTTIMLLGLLVHLLC